MARLPRLVVPHQPHHVLQRGNDRQKIFHDSDDYTAFLGWLRTAAMQFKVAIHAYVLMPDHLHLLLTPSDETGLARMMQWVGRYYVPYFNRKYDRSGTLWQGRYKATVLDAEQYLLLCCRFIEHNPVRAGRVNEPGDYHWSSYPHHSGAKSDPIITDHALYWALGNTPFEREAVYKDLMASGFDEREVRALQHATATGWALGSTQFQASLERSVQRRVRPAKRGRPPSAASVGKMSSAKLPGHPKDRPE